MSIDFEKLLFWATVISGLIVLLDILIFRPLRKRKQARAFPNVARKEAKPIFILEYAHAFFPVLFIVLVLRSFLFEPFRIPSGSLEPTLLMGDFILANKFDYGVRLPVFRTKIIPVGMPKRGDIAVFRWPPNPHFYFIKRIVGVPGDHLDYLNKVLIVNGQPATQTDDAVTIGEKTTQHENGALVKVVEKQEDLAGVKHYIYQEPNKVGYNFQNIIVPTGMYMMMGDNRDDSADSRYWGFVPEENIVGKAVLIWLSWDPFAAYNLHKIRWYRMGRIIN
jgi:signal peptidase I